MSKYNYSKSALKGLGIGHFLSEVKVRESHISSAVPSDIKATFGENITASRLHPHIQHVKISEITVDSDSKTFTLIPDIEKGTAELAYFRAGQYISVVVTMPDGKRITKPYTLQSSPKEALEGIYRITVKRSPSGHTSEQIFSRWEKGDRIAISGPLGYFYHQQLRDAEHVVAVAGGSGITPFVSMASAVADGTENFRLTILYGSRTEKSIILKSQLDNIMANSAGRVRVVYVLSDEQKEGFENGFVTAELIRRYAGNGDYSIYACGPKAMYSFLHSEVNRLGLSARRARFEVPGEYGDPSSDEKFPSEFNGKMFKLHIIARDREYDTECFSNQPIINACEEAGVGVTTDCRSGICGWCHSRLVSGNIYVPESADGRREADRKFGWIHPCATYPLSDITIEVFPSI